ncbi:hypothetical protein ACHAWF_011735 [Thalassiosira exigua]
MNKNSSPYHSAGWLLNEHLQKRRGIKSIAFDGQNGKGKGAPDKATYATVCKTIQHIPAINEILNANNKKLSKGIGLDSVRNKGLMYVMLHELLFGKYKSIRGGGKIKRMIVKHEKELRHEVDNYVSKHGEPGGSKGYANFPRYIRVNTLRSNIPDVLGHIREDLNGTETTSASDCAGSIYADAHVPNLLVLPPSASSWLHHDHELVKLGKIVLQDKSSCFPALVLAHGLGDMNEDEADSFDCIDACSAPGNKTSHLAALVHTSLGDVVQPKKKRRGKVVKPKSTIFAFERTSTRYNILKDRMEQLVTSPSENGNKVVVEPVHGDFLKANPSDPKFSNVRAIMLDPSCSGSGIVNSPDRWSEESDNPKDEKRIQSLSNFQLVALKHAMSFPNVDMIVYSTCSVHEEENEAVVSKALSEVDDFEDENQWTLMPPACLDHWPRRGKEGGIGGLTKSQAHCLVRCDGLDGDETNGFFVAFFVRKKLNAGEKKSQEKICNGSVGIPIYEGQFAQVICRKGDDATVAASGNNTVGQKESEQVRQSTKGQAEQQTNTKKQSVLQPKAKKREKKLAWKRKQALQKAQRLKKKEVCNTGESIRSKSPKKLDAP